MPPPKRRGQLGTAASLRDDLLLARDAVGIARCGAERLRGTLYLLHGTEQWSAHQVEQARALLRDEVERGCTAFAVMHRGDASQLAAADALRSVLLQPIDGTQTAKSLRQQAMAAHDCFLSTDAIRKRELPIVQLIADNVFERLQDQQVEILPSKDSIFAVLGPYAELAHLTVANAAKLFSQRAALHDDTVLSDAVAHALWAVAQFGVLPTYALQRLEAMGISELTDQVIAYQLEGMIRVPFAAEPDDVNQLATAIQLGEDPNTFYDRLLSTPVMRPVVERFVHWISGHDPMRCLYDSNDVMVGYCGPHYYAALCESFVFDAADYASGEAAAEYEVMLEGVAIGSRRQRGSEAEAEPPM